MLWESWIFQRGQQPRLSQRKAAELHALLFRDPDDFQLANVLYLWCERITDIETKAGLAKLPDPAQNLVTVWGIKGLVDNGGLSCLMSSALDDLSHIPDAFEAIGAYGCARILQLAIAFFPNAITLRTTEKRKAYIAQHADEWAQISALDDEFYRCGQGMDRQLGDYLRRHQNELRSIPPFETDCTRQIPARLAFRMTSVSTNDEVCEWVKLIGGHADAFTRESGEGCVSVRLNRHRRCVVEDFRNLALTRFASTVTLLSLSECGLYDAELQSLSAFTNLSDLDVSGNHLSDVGVALLASHAGLRYLDLGSAKLTEKGFQTLGQLPLLDSLLLRYVQPNAAALQWLESLQNLNWLCLMDTVLDVSCCEALCRLTGLRQLDLRDCQIPPRGIELLQSRFSPAILEI